uniref:tRNA lysidine(34) synthetase TilS n=1 Tax=Polaribacter sp. TaxID=1920175 RepID=UPI004048AC9F
MLKKVALHIDEALPFLNKASLLIAVSGGLDSVVLSHILHRLDHNIAIAHCNFNLRGIESDLDEKFVFELGNSLGITTHLTSFQTTEIAAKNKSSIQLTARKLRYDWFQQLLLNHRYDYVLTAHHLDDNLETFLINFSRGTGLDGLLGIPVINENIVRPLLPFSRDEIKQFAISEKITWREDQSNASNKYLRNKIRHQIVPVLKEINPNLLDSFLKTNRFLKQSQNLINEHMKAIKEGLWFEDSNGIINIDIAKLKQSKNPKAILYQLLKDYHFTAWEDIYHLLEAQSGKKVFSKTHQLLKDRMFLLLSKKTLSSKNDAIFKIDENTEQIDAPISIKFTEVTSVGLKSKNQIYIDKDLLSFPLHLRKWQKGDVFYPFGMKGKKKLSDYFKDEKFSLLEKDQTWLLCTNNEIVWIVGKRQDERFNAENSSKNILQILFNQ